MLAFYVIVYVSQKSTRPIIAISTGLLPYAGSSFVPHKYTAFALHKA
jgi:hypothetical protein